MQPGNEPPRGLRIEFLADHPQHARQVADWGFEAWGHLNPGQTRDSRYFDLLGELGRGEIPTTWIALDSSQALLATVALVNDDMIGDPRNPWLASVFVDPPWRRRGIAAALVRTVEDQARRLGIPGLYLYTPEHERLYARLGWSSLERCDYHGEAVTIMQRQLAGAL